MHKKGDPLEDDVRCSERPRLAAVQAATLHMMSVQTVRCSEPLVCAVRVTQILNHSVCSCMCVCILA